jgi:hypothetical protein
MRLEGEKREMTRCLGGTRDGEINISMFTVQIVGRWQARRPVRSWRMRIATTDDEYQVDLALVLFGWNRPSMP